MAVFHRTDLAWAVQPQGQYVKPPGAKSFGFLRRRSSASKLATKNFTGAHYGRGAENTSCALTVKGPRGGSGGYQPP